MIKFQPKSISLFLPRDGYLLLGIGLLAAFAVLWNLGKGSLDDWDEAIYAQISKEMVQSRDWVTPHWGYEAWFEKPPLFMWLTAGFFSLFGISEFWARAASAFSGIGILIVTYFIGKLIYGRSVGIFSVIILLTSYDFIYRSRFGTTDVLLTFFILLSIYAYLQLKKDSWNWWYLIWISFALAFMTKGVGALVILPIIAISLWFDKSWIVSLQSRQFWLGGLLALLIITPWHILMVTKYGMTFINVYIGKHVIVRVNNSLDTHTGDSWFYVWQLQRGFFPWFYVAPFALVMSLQENLTSRHRSRILLSFFCLVFGLYTLVQTKLDWYIFPVYPVLAILVASILIKAVKPFHLFAFGGLIIGGVIMASPINLMKGLMMAGLSLIVILLYLVEFKKGIYKKLSYQLVSIVWCAGFIFVGIRQIVPLYYNEETPVARLAHIAAEGSSYHKPLIVLVSATPDLYYPTVLFYSDRPTQIAGNLEDLASYTKDGRIHEIFLIKKATDVLTGDYEIKIMSVDHPLIYGTIQQKSCQ